MQLNVIGSISLHLLGRCRGGGLVVTLDSEALGSIPAVAKLLFKSTNPSVSELGCGENGYLMGVTRHCFRSSKGVPSACRCQDLSQV